MQLLTACSRKVFFVSLLTIANIAFALPPFQMTDSKPMMVMPLVIPIAIQDEWTSSTLLVVNNSAITAGAKVSVRDNSGTLVSQIHFTLQPHEKKELSVATMLADTPTPPRFVSIVINQDENLKGMTVAAQLLMTSRGGAVPSYIDEETTMPSAGGSTLLRAVTDEHDGPILLALTNLESTPQQVKIECTGRLRTTGGGVPLVLAPLATSVTEGCTGKAVRETNSYRSSVHESGNRSVEDIQITGSGPAGTLAAFAIAAHKREGGIIFSSIPFSDPGLTNSSDTVFSGVPIGTQSVLPDGQYVPHLTLANFSPSPAHITVSLATTPTESSTDSNPALTPTQLQVVQQLTLFPQQSTEVVLDGSPSDTGLLHAVVVSSDQAPGAVESKLVSRGDGTLFEVELLGKDAKDENDGGIHPWSIEQDNNSDILIVNHTTTERKLNIAISNGSILWTKNYVLSPYQTIDLSINKLIEDKVHDDHGRILDSHLKRGVVNWMTPDSGTVTGRLMVSSRSDLPPKSVQVIL